MRYITATLLLSLMACTTGAVIPDDDTGLDTGITDPDIDTGDTDPNTDYDGDGYTDAEGDCQDGDPTVNPGVPEVPYDGIDNDCDPATLDDDLDQDGFGIDEDCDDDFASINPYASDFVGDNIDQNCDGVDGVDFDGDTYASIISGGDDCDDTDPTTHPGAEEIWYDGVDQQCDGVVDDDDQDGDGFDLVDDCDDTDAEVNPLAVEDNTNGIDDNCSGTADDFGLTLTPDSAGLTLEVSDYMPNTADFVVLIMVDTMGKESRMSTGNIIDATGYVSGYFVQCDDEREMVDCTHWVEGDDLSDITFRLDSSYGCFTWGYDTSLYSGCTVGDPTTW